MLPNPTGANRAMVTREEPQTTVVEVETGENLMLQQTLIMDIKDTAEGEWRRRVY